MRRMRLLAGLAFVLAACSDDATRPPVVQVEGKYSLQTVNGAALPFSLVSLPGFNMDHTAGTVTLNADRTFREEDLVESRFNDEQGNPVVEKTTIAFTGTWQNQDSVVTVNISQRIINGQTAAFADVMFGFVSGNRLTLNFEVGDSLFTYVYRRD